MKIFHLIQGTPKWDAHRANPFMHNASDAPAMLGCDDKRTRSELMRERASGSKREFSPFVQERVLNKGHRNEAFGRAHADSTWRFPLNSIHRATLVLAACSIRVAHRQFALQ